MAATRLWNVSEISGQCRRANPEAVTNLLSSKTFAPKLDSLGFALSRDCRSLPAVGLHAGALPRSETGMKSETSRRRRNRAAAKPGLVIVASGGCGRKISASS